MDSTRLRRLGLQARRLGRLQLIVILALGFAAWTVPAFADCTLIQTTETVCVQNADGSWDCTETVREEWVCDGSGGDGTGGTSGCLVLAGADAACDSGGGGGGGTSGGNSNDTDANGVIDDWKKVISTVDPCANNFDTNDRLGSNHGGPNTIRPSHSGVDIQGDRHDLVFSMKSGEVTAVNSDSSCGYYVIIRHFDNSQASYCHMVTGSAPVNVGDQVAAGESIGRVNSTGNSTGDHLHVTYRDANGNKQEYQNHTDTPPSSSQLDPGGC